MILLFLFLTSLFSMFSFCIFLFFDDLESLFNASRVCPERPYNDLDLYDNMKSQISTIINPAILAAVK